MRLPAVLLVVCLAVAGCGGGEDESSSGSSSGESSGGSSGESSEPAQAIEGDSGPDYEAYDDSELCQGPFQSWMEADAAANQELRKASAEGPVDEATVEQILEPATLKVEGLATADDEELASLAGEYPELSKDFALAFAGEGADPQEQTDAIEAVTDAKAAIIDRCLSLAAP